MMTVETIGRIRRAFLVDHKPIRQIVRELRLSRKTVRKAIRGASTEFRYKRQVQPQPRLGAFVGRLDGLLEANSKRPARERLTARRLFELLRAEATGVPMTACSVMCASGRRARSQQGALIRLVVRAHRFHDMLIKQKAGKFGDLAKSERLNRSYFSRLLRLAYLAPDITAAILDGHQPAGITTTTLIERADLRMSWREQRRTLGLA